MRSREKGKCLDPAAIGTVEGRKRLGSTAGGHLSRFYMLALMRHSILNTGLYMCVFASLRHIPRSRIAR